VFNSSIVGLCSLNAVDDGDADDYVWTEPDNEARGGSGSASSEKRGPSFLRQLPVDPQPVFRCHGLGIVRAVDPHTSKLYLLTPVSSDELENVDLLVLGETPLPTVLASTGEQSGLPEPYLVRQSLSTKDGGAAGSIKSRNNLQKHTHRSIDR